MIDLLATWLCSPLLWLRIALRPRRPMRHIIVIQTAKIGDFVNTTPVFRALRKTFPEARITAIVHPVTAPFARALGTLDDIVQLWGYKGIAGKRWLYRAVARADAVLTLSPNRATFLVPFWAGVPTRVSVLPDRRRGIVRLAWPFLSYGESHRHGRLFRETMLRALVGLGVAVDDALLALPNEAPVSDAALSRAQSELAGKACPRPWVGLAVGAGNRLKALLPQQLETLAKGIIERTGGTVILVGTEADREVAAALRSALPADHALDTTGQWRLDELPALLKTMDVFVGVDSGALYIADAVGVPVIDIMGPADPEDMRPVGARAIIIPGNVVCAPCSHTFDAPYHCKREDRACITRLNLEGLLAHVAGVTTGSPPASHESGADQSSIETTTSPRQ